MKRYSSLVRFKFKAGMLLGFLAAAAILLTDLSPDTYRGKEIQVQTGQEDDNGGDHTAKVSAGKNLVASVSQLTLVHAWHFIADIYLDSGEDQVITGLDIREFNTWFKTLFRLIISPNAP